MTVPVQILTELLADNLPKRQSAGGHSESDSLDQELEFRSLLLQTVRISTHERLTANKPAHTNINTRRIGILISIWESHSTQQSGAESLINAKAPVYNLSFLFDVLKGENKPFLFQDTVQHLPSGTHFSSRVVQCTLPYVTKHVWNQRVC